MPDETRGGTPDEVAGPPELADFNFLDRDRILREAAERLRTAYFENVVLTAYRDLRDGHADRLLHELVYDESVNTRLEVSAGPPRELELLDAVLAVERDPSRRLTPEEVDLEVAGRLPGALRVGRFTDFLELALAERGGRFPRHDTAHWLAHYTRADAFDTTLRAGAHLDAVRTGQPPSILEEGIPAKALAVARSRAALRNDRAAHDTANLRVQDLRRDLPAGRYAAAGALGTAGPVVTEAIHPLLTGGTIGLAAGALMVAVDRSVRRRHGRDTELATREQAATAQRVAERAEADFGTALGLGRPNRPPQPPAQGLRR